MGAGVARRFVLRLARGAIWAAEVELSRVGVEGEASWPVGGDAGAVWLFGSFPSV